MGGLMWWTICQAAVRNTLGQRFLLSFSGAGEQRRWRCLPGFFLAASLLALVTCQSPAADAPAFDDAALEFFEKEVRPILTARCLECHGGGKGDPKGGLSLTSRAAALKGGDTGPAVMPGKAKESLLVSAIEYGDLYQMPPKSKLPAKEIAILAKWVDLGAPWPQDSATAAGKVKPFDLKARKAEHWCWQPVAEPPVPTVKDASWPISVPDRFILAKLEDKGLKPAPPAAKQTLLRRVYFDLIGLPPSPEEVDAFLNDQSPQALEHVVDRLLQSVHFGERWGRHWLDLVRYAETRGHEFEPIIPNAWQYRDYVIRALNSDVPYDRYLQEHIAGDLLPPRWRDPSADVPVKINESVLGTGFWFLGEEVHSPVDIRKDETDRMDNRLDVMSKTFLGLTVSCARCHDHKFDAISQRDYYAMTGYLLSGSYRQVRVQTQENDRQIAVELAKSRSTAERDIAAVLKSSTKPTLDRLNQYILTARQAVLDGMIPERSEINPQDLMFADFEGDSYGDWKAEGTAFGDRPPRKSDNVYNAPLEGFRGERLANSHRNALNGTNDAAARDAHTGKLVSPPFTIDHSLIRFLVGGGNHPGRTCINLEVDGKVVRSATGQNSGTLRTEQWQVNDLRGKRARIEIVDAETGGWGHILVDQIVFSNDAPSRDTQMKDDPVARQKTGLLANQNHLNPDLLWSWCVELASARSQKKHLLHAIVANEQPQSGPRPQSDSPPGLVVDFGAPRPGDMIRDGVSFGLRPKQVGQLQIRSVGQPDLGVVTVGGWERDLFWKSQSLAAGTEDDHSAMGSWHRHGRMVRTPEFTFSHNRLWYLVRGSVRAYVSVNSHLVIAGPLHGALLKEFKHADDQWHWVSHGLELYRGHRMHVEFSPGDDVECCVAMVAQCDDSPTLPDLTVELPVGEDLEKRAELLRDQFVAAAQFLSQPPDESRSITRSQAALADWFVQHLDLFATAQDNKAIHQRLATLREEESRLAARVQWESQLAPAMLDGNAVDEFLLIRGNSSTPRDLVHRRFLEALGGDEQPETESGSGRPALAQQMLRSPLAARVAVNRIWYHLFGRGIVPSVDNMGVLGQAPTHPELLDHLATQFIKDGWSTKRMIKGLLLSRTYQMSSHPSEPAETIDPDNLLWHRMPIKRLEGEVIRDSLLAVSGRLDRTPFGPSVPIHLTPFMEGRGRPGVSGPIDGNGRRSIYIAVRRNFLSPMMLAFDTPSPFSTVGRRTSSNVPAQALILMNDPLVIEQAKRWAEKALSGPPQSAEQRIDNLYQTAFARHAGPAEVTEALEFLDAQAARFGIPAAERRSAPQAWADLCHVMFNLKEFVFVE